MKLQMKAKHQRLVLAGIALVAIIGAALLAMSAMKDKAAYFYTPSELRAAKIGPDKTARLGGMVAANSIRYLGDGTQIAFVVSDGKQSIPVRFKGIAPDLFKENSGVIAEGRLSPDGSFIATELLAKHDEKYMPPNMANMADAPAKATR